MFRERTERSVESFKISDFVTRVSTGAAGRRDGGVDKEIERERERERREWGNMVSR